MVTVGDSKARFYLSITVRSAGGWREGWLIYSDSLLELEQITQEFYDKRAAMHRKINSSAYLFGGNFEIDSLEWLICHSVSIELWDGDEKISEHFVRHPYLEEIENRW